MKFKIVRIISCIGILMIIVGIFAQISIRETKEYTVTFDSDGGSVVESVKVKENSTVTAPENPIKSGYYFMYWMDENEKQYDFSNKIKENITLKAYWVPIGENEE